MPAQLPPLTPETFAAELRPWLGERPDPRTLDRLRAHYEELRRWNDKLSLVGPGTVGEVLARHYGESLVGLGRMTVADRSLVDLGSGGGFPGFVLAAARPDVAVTLVEARQRKWAFLRSAARRASLPCQCLNARVSSPLPGGVPAEIDVITLRAVRIPVPAMEELCQRLRPGGRVLLWAGEDVPEMPESLEPEAEIPLPGSERRRILELRPSRGS